MTATSLPVARIGGFLVQLERLERAQRPGVFLVDRIEATSRGVRIVQPSGLEVELHPDASTTSIGRPSQLRYALGAYEAAILADALVQVLHVERHGSSATVQVLRGPHNTLETYSIDLDRMIDIGLADTLAFAPAYRRVNGSLNQP